MLAAMLMLATPAAMAQKTPASPKQPAPAQQTVPEPETPPKADSPGLINELGKLFVKPSDLFPSLKTAPNAAAPTVSPQLPGDTTAATTPAAPVTPPMAAPPAPAPPAVAAPAQPASPPAPAPGLIPQMVTGRATCPASANGAPDCKAGADQLCKTKGYAAGRSLDMDSAQNCSTQALLAGARTIKDICKTETFVTRAMCQ